MSRRHQASPTTIDDYVSTLVLSDTELRAVTDIAARMFIAQRNRFFTVLVHSGVRERLFEMAE
jgi:hypothetical protein